MVPKKHGRRPPAAQETRKEIKYYGTAACLALWQRRPHDVIRIYLEEARVPALSAMLKWAAAERKAYHLVAAADLEKLTESIHHQGVCVLAREQIALSFQEWLPLLRQERDPQLLLYLDGVENPHNLGALLRTCAHFGIRYVLGPAEHLPKLSPSACRVAEGGAEEVMLVRLPQAAKQLRQLQEYGYQLLGTHVRQGTSVFTHQFGERSILILGSEVAGVAPALMKTADEVLTIPGSGRVESLNVSVAFGVVAGEYARQRGQRAPLKTASHKVPDKNPRTPRHRR